VLRALRIDREGDDTSRIAGAATTAWSSGRHLRDEFAPEREGRAIRFDATLADGTVAGGLLFPYDGAGERAAPLWIASFGLLQHRWGAEASKFHDLYLADPETRIRAHVAILDHPTSAPFFASNGCLSMGAYDDARMWMELVPILRRMVRVSTVHLFGVSMSGQTVVHAMLEDQRRGTRLFASGIAVSIAPDFRRAPGGQFALLECPPGVPNPWPRDPLDRSSRIERMVQVTGLETLVRTQFVAAYRRLRPSESGFQVESDRIAPVFREAFERRIAFLRERHRDDPTWNRAVPLTDLDAFLRATRIAGVISAVRAPLVLVSAYDDPAVSRDQFGEVAAACADNGWIALHETLAGGHFAFEVPYGPDYLGNLLRLLADPAVVRNWLAP